MSQIPRLLLLPIPQSLELKPGWCQLHNDQISVSGIEQSFIDAILNGYPAKLTCKFIAASDHDSVISCHIDNSSAELAEHSDESYSLNIPETTESVSHRIVISSPSQQGLINGLKTLAQLIHQCGTKLPALTIRDFPSFPNRGVMLDISRDRVPTMEELQWVVRLLSSWKINHLQLYTEHTFAYRGHEKVWQNASAMTPEEIRRLDAFCSEHGVTLAANQNCFGHMERWLKHPEYAHLAETHGEWSFAGIPRSGPFSLCPAASGSIELIKDLIDQLLPCFSSAMVNIGCDETFDVGQGRSAEAVASRGKASVYFDYISRIVDLVVAQNFNPMFWADMALRASEHVNLIPQELTCLVWNYEPDAKFAEWCELLIGSGHEAWVCPGTSSWRSITGRTSERRANIIAAAEQGTASGANGFMVTDWGDLGHRQQWSVSLNALAQAAGAGWNACNASEYDTESISFHAFGDRTNETSTWMDQLGDLDLNLRRIAGIPAENRTPQPLRNATCLFNEMEAPLSEDIIAGDLSDWKDVEDKVAELMKSKPKILDELIEAELNHTLEVTDFAIRKALLKLDSDKISADERKNLINRMRDIIAEHRRLWSLRSRPGGLDDSCRYYERIIEDINSD